MKSEAVRIMIDLDCLKDTRLTTVGKLSEDAFKNILADPETYLTRNRDDWHVLTKGLVTQEVFNDEFSRRDKFIFFSAPPTNLYFELKDIITDSMRDIFDEKVKENKLELIVNLYPYQLTRSEIITLRNVLELEYAARNQYFDIKFTFKPLGQITEEYLKTSVDTVFMYSFHDWLEEAANNDIKSLNIPHVNLVVPMLLKEGFWSIDASDKISIYVNELNKEVVIPTSPAVKMMNDDYLSIDLAAPRLFSIVDKDVLQRRLLDI